MAELLCLAQRAQHQARADALAARVCRDGERAKQQGGSPGTRADVPEARRADETAVVDCRERQSVGCEAVLAQPFGRFCEACRAKGRVEKALACCDIGRTFIADGHHCNSFQPSRQTTASEGEPAFCASSRLSSPAMRVG